MLSVFVGALQVMLDRGPLRDWFNSTEIKVEAVVAALAFYLFLTHTLTARRPFVRLAMYRDRNFLTGNVLIFLVGIVLFATLALLPPLLQNLLGYSVFQSGLVTAPRGLGTLVAMMVVGRIVGRVDVRLIIGTGLALTALSMWQMTGFSLQMGMSPIVSSGLIQGFGTGIVYVPMATLTFVTLPATMRNEGTALFNLVRNVGSSIGISAVQALFTRNTQVMHASLAAHITPFVFATHALGTYVGRAAEAALNGMLTAQAAMIAYLDDFHLMFVMTLLSIPLLLFVRNARPSARGEANVVVE
jgi:MFS transporter, DHA2 family, multidrug resistance protein